MAIAYPLAVSVVTVAISLAVIVFVVEALHSVAFRLDGRGRTLSGSLAAFTPFPACTLASLFLVWTTLPTVA